MTSPAFGTKTKTPRGVFWFGKRSEARLFRIKQLSPTEVLSSNALKGKTPRGVFWFGKKYFVFLIVRR
jgi:hypothetical protein